MAGAALQRLTVALDAYDLSSASDALADLGTSGLGAWAADELGRLRQCTTHTNTTRRATIASASPCACANVGRVTSKGGGWLRELSDCRVLIVDDVKANVDVLVQALRDDYKLSVALGGQQALDAVAGARPISSCSTS